MKEPTLEEKMNNVNKRTMSLENSYDELRDELNALVKHLKLEFIPKAQIVVDGHFIDSKGDVIK